MTESIRDSSTEPATQVGWPAFKRARRLRWHQATNADLSRSTTRRRRAKLDDQSHDERMATRNKCACDKIMNSSSGQPTTTTTTTKTKTKTTKRSLIINLNRETTTTKTTQNRSLALKRIVLSILALQLISLVQNDWLELDLRRQIKPWASPSVDASLIIGDSAIEIQEADQSDGRPDQQQQQQQHEQQKSHPNPQQESIILSSTGRGELESYQFAQPNAQQEINQNDGLPGSASNGHQQQAEERPAAPTAALEVSRLPSGPLPPLGKPNEDITDGDKKSRNNHDYDINELNLSGSRENEKEALSEVLLGSRQPSPGGHSSPSKLDKTITGKVVDFELDLAGGHNKAKIKKKQMKKSEEAFKKWGKKKKMEKKAMEKEEKKHMKKKEEEGKKGKKKWGLEVHGQKKKGNFKKKKWGKKVKKGKGVKKGKKGKKFLKDKGHKNTGFKTVYHKEEWGKSSKWHDIKREKKWDEKSKKWKKKWKKEKGKNYKGDHMKKFEKKKKKGKKYKKAKKEKFKKFKKEEFEKGKKKKMEEHAKKKEGGAKKEKMELKKKKKKL